MSESHAASEMLRGQEASISDVRNVSRADALAGNPTQGPPLDQQADNSVIRQMRATVEQAQREAQEAKRAAEAAAREREALAAELKDLKDTKQAEGGRSEKELEELRPLRDRVGRYTNTFKVLYEQELASVPESQREAVTRLSQAADWDERLELLRNAKSLLSPAVAQPVPQAMGTTTNPGARENPSESPRLDPRNPPSLKEAFQREAVRGPSFSSKQLAEMVKQQLEEVLGNRIRG